MEITDKIRIYNEDCLEAIKKIPDKAYDLAIVDPPYGIGEDGGTNGSRSKMTKSKVYISKGWDKEPPSREYFNELKRVSKNQIIWGANHFIDRVPYASSSWVVWNKENGATDFADCELAYTSFTTAVRMFTWRWQGMLQGDMKNKEQRIHPTQKPVKLYEWLLHNYAKEGDKILDTHLGSGSIAMACHNKGYDLTAYEIDKEYFEATTKRIKGHISQLTMF